MLPTFSVNTNVYTKMPKVTKLNLNPLRQIEQEWLSEAFVKIIEGKPQEKINLKAYSESCERNSQLIRARKNEVSLLNQDELMMGYKGVTETQLMYEDTNFDDVIEDMDIESNVTAFLEMRELVYIVECEDLWRLLELSRMDDRKAQRKLREIIAKIDTDDNMKYIPKRISTIFPTFKSLIEYLINTPSCYVKIDNILA